MFHARSTATGALITQMGNVLVSDDAQQLHVFLELRFPIPFEISDEPVPIGFTTWTIGELIAFEEGLVGDED